MSYINADLVFLVKMQIVDVEDQNTGSAVNSMSAFTVTAEMAKLLKKNASSSSHRCSDTALFHRSKLDI